MYIKEKSLSVGYNNINGQEFFNILNERKPWINSYFFSVGETYNSAQMDIDKEIERICKLNTYDIPGNLLFNSFDLNKYYYGEHLNIIAKLKNYINLSKITCLNMEMAKNIKYTFPDLEIHLSVRYFQANWDNLDISKYKDMVDKWFGIADVINLDAIRSLTDYELNLFDYKTYEIFLEYLEERSKCKLICGECKKCEKFYNDIEKINRG